MGLAPVKGTVSQALKATNTGEAAVNCTWKTGLPFSMVPESASIEANQSFTFMCHFQPPEASVYIVVAACHADTGYTATVKVGRLTASSSPAPAYECICNHSKQDCHACCHYQNPNPATSLVAVKHLCLVYMWHAVGSVSFFCATLRTTESGVGPDMTRTVTPPPYV